VLRAAVAVHYVCNIEQRRSAGLARVGDGEYALQKSVEIDDGNHAAFDLERLFLRIPPTMGNAGRKHSRLTNSHLDRRAPDHGAHYSGDDLAFLALD